MFFSRRHQDAKRGTEGLDKGSLPDGRSTAAPEERGRRGPYKIENTGYELLSNEVMKKVSDTQTPQGALVVLNRPSYTLEDIVGNGEGTFMVLENLQDPGNLGTIIRTGEGAGIRGVIMSQDTVDIYNPKTIRATMGSVYRVPFIYVETLSNSICYLKEKGVRTYAAHLKGTKQYYEFSYTGGTAFLIGNEGNGLKKRLRTWRTNICVFPWKDR